MIKSLETHDNVRKIAFISCFAICLLPQVSAPFALLLGLVCAQIIGNPFPSYSARISKNLLKVAVVLIGFKMDFFTAMNAGKEGISLTLITIVATLIGGYFLGKIFKLDKKMSFLIASGTAICGGSAIAAVASSIRPNDQQISVSLGIVFILNAIGLLIFPMIGHFLQMSQADFGVWSAIAIHDTSAVVGAAKEYGAEALQTATTIKLTRALWIMPLTVVAGLLFKEGGKKISIPYFIFWFIGAMFFNSMIDGYDPIFGFLADSGKKGLVLVLFLIGSGISTEALKKVGFKALAMGVLLWLFITILTLFIAI